VNSEELSETPGTSDMMSVRVSLLDGLPLLGKTGRYGKAGLPSACRTKGAGLICGETALGTVHGEYLRIGTFSELCLHAGGSFPGVR
jgi:hypothetical protein